MKFVILGKEDNFLKYDTTRADTLNTPYDYGSIMHYGKAYFSKNGSDTIVPVQPNVDIGQRVSLSPIDILAVRKLYNCPDPTTTTTTLTTLTTTTAQKTTTTTTRASGITTTTGTILTNETNPIIGTTLSISSN